MNRSLRSDLTPAGILRENHLEISAYLEIIAKLWKPGAKLTLLVRRPEAPDGSQDYLATDDDLDQAIEALRVLKARGATEP